ncbi:MAG: prepilin-type N-terminal cleavage/methylation domain-containing protein [Verrucomicrobia bacterium]|nr:prepilin-type N-terminal cleavage/methylation domain-containing protein [Verrucomicrobiota bacterium]
MPLKTTRHAPAAFTIVEVLMAVTIFGLIMVGIYATWTAIVQGSKAGLSAAAQAQRARISIRAIEEALVTAQMFSASAKPKRMRYYFLADSEKQSLSFVARLPATFPGVGRYGDTVVRRIEFSVDENRNLIMTQMPMLVADTAEEHDIKPYRLQLAQDVTLFMFEFWDDQKKEYVAEWAKTNQLPHLVRVAVGLGKMQNSQAPQDLVTKTVAMPAMAIPGQYQTAPMMPGMPPGGIPPGGIPPGGIPPGGLPPGVFPGGGLRQPPITR